MANLLKRIRVALPIHPASWLAPMRGQFLILSASYSEAGIHWHSFLGIFRSEEANAPRSTNADCFLRILNILGARRIGEGQVAGRISHREKVAIHSDCLFTGGSNHN